MKRLVSATAALLLALAVLASAGAFAGPATTADRAHGAGHAHGSTGSCNGTKPPTRPS